MIRVVLADDEEMLRGALASLLSLEDDLEIVAQAADGAEAVRLAGEHRPDVVLMDLEMPGTDGIEAAAALAQNPDPPMVVIVTRHARPGVLTRALKAGVQGFVPKSSPAEQLAEVIRAVVSGQRYVDPRIAADALALDCPLTERELEALRLTRDGLSVLEIGERLHLAHGTIRNYLSNAISKTQTSNRHAAARHAADQGWL